MKALGWAMVVLGVAAAAAQARDTVQVRQLDVQEDRVAAWNRFAEELLQLHRRQIAGKKIEQTETVGGYAGLPRFYREVTYVDADSKRVLSRIQWEREQPERVHTIEVYLYDEHGRVSRDYMAWYLPQRRNAPRDTAINLYHYADGLRGWRQFDASDRRTYEKCSVWRDDKEQKTLIELSEGALEEAIDNPKSIADRASYERCFAGLASSAGRHLNPQ
jgi:hypothetical protein